MTTGDRCNERGMALLIALMAIQLVMALGTALILAASVESKIARNFGNSSKALYAAEAASERAIDDLRNMPDWNAALSGTASSAWSDGPAGERTIADGRRIDLNEIVGLAMSAVRPWGANNPQWRLFASGALKDLLPGAASDSPFYVVVLVADDPSENDGNPLADGVTACEPGAAEPCNPGTGRIVLRAEAFGPFGAHTLLELTVARPGAIERQADYNSGVDQAGVRILSWRELR